MPSVLGRAVLFLSSYAPLLLILTGWYERTGHSRLAFLFLALTSIGVVGSWTFLRRARLLGAQTIVPSVVRSSRSYDWLAYAVGYALPLLNLTSSDKTKTLGVSVLFILIAVLYVSLNLCHINPLLALARYHLTEVELAKETCLLIYRRRPRPGTPHRVVQLGDRIYMEVT